MVRNLLAALPNVAPMTCMFDWTRSNDEDFGFAAIFTGLALLVTTLNVLASVAVATRTRGFTDAPKNSAATPR